MKAGALCSFAWAQSLLFSVLALISCASPTDRHLIEQTALAYRHAFERAADDRVLSTPPPPLSIVTSPAGVEIEAREADLDQLVMRLRPDLLWDDLPASWIGKPISISLQGASPTACLDQILALEGASWNVEKGRTRIRLPTESGSSAERVAHTIQLQHNALLSVQTSLKQFLDLGGLKTRLAWSPQSNQVFLVGPVNEVERLTDLIEKLDRAPGIVRVRAWLATAREVENLRFKPQPLLTDNGWTLNLAAPPPIENVFQSNAGSIQFSLASTSETPNQESLQINAFISRALKSAVSAPSLLCLSGNSAKLYAGRVGWRLFTTPTSATSSSISTQNITTGLTLTMTPRILGSEKIDLKIEVSLSAFSNDVALVANQTARSAATLVRMRPGDLLRVAGIRVPRWNTTDQGLMGLRKLPVVQWFTSSINELDQDDVLDLYLTAEIADLCGQDPLATPLLERLGSGFDQRVRESL
jgi:hypothetical protein